MKVACLLSWCAALVVSTFGACNEQVESHGAGAWNGENLVDLYDEVASLPRVAALTHYQKITLPHDALGCAVTIAYLNKLNGGDPLEVALYSSVGEGLASKPGTLLTKGSTMDMTPHPQYPATLYMTDVQLEEKLNLRKGSYWIAFKNVWQFLHRSTTNDEIFFIDEDGESDTFPVPIYTDVVNVHPPLVAGTNDVGESVSVFLKTGKVESNGQWAPSVDQSVCSELYGGFANRNDMYSPKWNPICQLELPLDADVQIAQRIQVDAVGRLCGFQVKAKFDELSHGVKFALYSHDAAANRPDKLLATSVPLEFSTGNEEVRFTWRQEFPVSTFHFSGQFKTYWVVAKFKSENVDIVLPAGEIQNGNGAYFDRIEYDDAFPAEKPTNQASFFKDCGALTGLMTFQLGVTVDETDVSQGTFVPTKSPTNYSPEDDVKVVLYFPNAVYEEAVHNTNAFRSYLVTLLEQAFGATSVRIEEVIPGSIAVVAMLVNPTKDPATGKKTLLQLLSSSDPYQLGDIALPEGVAPTKAPTTNGDSAVPPPTTPPTNSDNGVASYLVAVYAMLAMIGGFLLGCLVVRWSRCWCGGRLAGAQGPGEEHKPSFIEGSNARTSPHPRDDQEQEGFSDIELTLQRT